MLLYIENVTLLKSALYHQMHLDAKNIFQEHLSNIMSKDREIIVLLLEVILLPLFLITISKAFKTQS